MPLLEWSPLLSTGIESIDQQHRVLLGLVNELNDALEDGTSDKHIKQIFDTHQGINSNAYQDSYPLLFNPVTKVLS